MVTTECIQFKLEKRLPYDPDRSLLIMCLEGEKAAPFEDVECIPGYTDFVEAMCNSQHHEHHRMLEWHGKLFEPTRFDKYVESQRNFRRLGPGAYNPISRLCPVELTLA